MPTAAVARKAAAWLDDGDQPAAVLIGASQLLMTDQRAAAVGALKGLLSEPDRRIAWLAFAQLWRAGSANATPEQWTNFAEKIDAADESLRGSLLRPGFGAQGQDPEAAALALLRVPLLYPREYDLSARALLDAGTCLQKVERPSQAAGLYRELLSRFGQAGAADEARRRLERLASSGSPGDN